MHNNIKLPPLLPKKLINDKPNHNTHLYLTRLQKYDFKENEKKYNYNILNDKNQELA